MHGESGPFFGLVVAEKDLGGSGTVTIGVNLAVVPLDAVEHRGPSCEIFEVEVYAIGLGERIEVCRVELEDVCRGEWPH